MVLGAFLYLRSLSPSQPLNSGSTTPVASSSPLPAAPAPAPAAPLVNSPGTAALEPETPTEPPIDMNSVSDLLNFGNLLLSEGKLEEAERIYRRAIDVNPDDEDTHFNLAIALNRQGRVEEAVAAYEEALTIFPDYVEAQHNIANALLSLGRTNDAIARLEEAVALNPDYGPVLNNLGRIRALGQEWDAAIELLARAVEVDPENYEYNFNLGTTHLRKGDFPKAVDALGKASELKPHDPLTVNLLSQALAFNKQPDRAMEIISTTLQVHPNNVELLFNLGQIQLHNGRPEAAKDTFLRVSVLAPEFKAAKSAMAQAQAAMEKQATPPPLKSAP